MRFLHVPLGGGKPGRLCDPAFREGRVARSGRRGGLAPLVFLSTVQKVTMREHEWEVFAYKPDCNIPFFMFQGEPDLDTRAPFALSGSKHSTRGSQRRRVPRHLLALIRQNGCSRSHSGRVSPTKAEGRKC